MLQRVEPAHASISRRVERFPEGTGRSCRRARSPQRSVSSRRRPLVARSARRTVSLNNTSPSLAVRNMGGSPDRSPYRVTPVDPSARVLGSMMRRDKPTRRDWRRDRHQENSATVGPRRARSTNGQTPTIPAGSGSPAVFNTQAPKPAPVRPKIRPQYDGRRRDAAVEQAAIGIDSVIDGCRVRMLRCKAVINGDTATADRFRSRPAYSSSPVAEPEVHNRRHGNAERSDRWTSQPCSNRPAAPTRHAARSFST